MTVKELREKLESISGDEFSVFIKKFGGTTESPESFVEAYCYNPEREKMERKLCYIFDIPTEDERRTSAAVQAGRGAKYAAIAAAISALISFGILLVAFVKK